MAENTISVTVDKTHIVTIGERLYGESVELIRELVNNAYDADASEVRIKISDDEIIISDNGSGMDRKDIEQYFNIGSPHKRLHRKSPKFDRDRIGEFGIGKFAVLSACPYFEVWTKKGDFQAKVVFDKDEWEKSPESWNLPFFAEPVDSEKPDGTVVTLKKLRKKFNLADVERRLIESVPLKAPHFSVFLNDKKVSPRFVPGHRIPFLEGTDFGVVHGEIIITPISRTDAKEAGVECKVKQATIRRDFFGIEKWEIGAARVTGEVNADFLPITSDRSDFIRDSEEYKAFRKVMERVMERVKKTVEELSDFKQNRRTKRVLTEVLERVKDSLFMNPEFCPEGLLPVGEEGKAGEGTPGFTGSGKPGKTERAAAKTEEQPKKKRMKRPSVKPLTPTAVVKRLAAGREGVSCLIDHFGPEGPECETQGTIITINRDHPLHQRAVKDREAYIFYLARLITQEISLMKDPRNPRQAFERQSKLLKDALA
ncbi:ATP-binding protein [Candidatus Desantisbacteria bacterium CG_4_10_14_0_8_um_filter_48_22]|uniref:ATP-binding protein n=1 Tax=Candidatus Desantisbacteria bacterium CG_4_10_14_0_8_um_filter_48_22 TaxID=1974543 RepID=A0A2M7SDI5_9BACT|nr:MAG: hypothetical protein AUJ67_00655 [Candidatus Desantisbacteria bacterium CG1_02_49_89]PIV56173.1 MAG: ATP-binding protein [Candidatus Desantisbacteria bacterium CG02_land_8_20_14_3_00_49_13]PIZ17530.1 MAG: ATP-binding protein [Candidatus Desantisbacteria bacterium CG_4_10_14_0_8_um_filter_48_22]